MAPNIFFCLLCWSVPILDSKWYISCDLGYNFQHWYLIYWIANASWISIFQYKNEERHFLPLTRGHTLERRFSYFQTNKDWAELPVYSSLGTIKTQYFTIIIIVNYFEVDFHFLFTSETLFFLNWNFYFKNCIEMKHAFLLFLINLTQAA